jgi:hypothetical protein
MRHFLLILLLALLTACGTGLGDPCYGRSDSAECNLYKSQLQTTLEANERQRIAEATRQSNEMDVQATRQASDVKQAEALANAGATATIEAARSQVAIDQANAQATITAARIAENKSNADATATSAANENQLSQARIAAQATEQAMRDQAEIAKAKAEAELEAAKWQTRIDLFVRFAIGLAVLGVGAGIALRIFHAIYQAVKNRSNTLRDAEGRLWLLRDGRIIDPRLLLQASTALDGSGNLNEDTALRVKERDQAANVYETMARNGHDVVGEDKDSAWTETDRQIDPPAPAEAINPPALPAAPPLMQLLREGYRPTANRMLLAYDTEGPVYGDLEHLLSVAIAGRQGMGKTTFLRFVCANCVMIGAHVELWDVHADVVKQLPGITAYTQAEEIRLSALRMLRELQRRIRGQLRDEVPILVMCDEANYVMNMVEETVDVIRELVFQGRKFRMYCMVSTKHVPAKMFGDAGVRDAFSAHVAYQCSRAVARMLGFDLETLDEFPVTQLPPGYALFDAGGRPRIIQVPNTTADDIRGLLPASRAASAVSGNGNGHGNGNGADMGMDTAVDMDKREQVRSLVKQGVKTTEIIKRVWNAAPGSAYVRASEEYKRILATLVS